MRFTVAIKRLADEIKDTLNILTRCRELYDKEGIAEPELKQTFDGIETNLKNLREKLSGILSANERTFEMIEFLTKALQLEHRVISELQNYLQAISDDQLREDLHQLIVEEKHHEDALANQLRQLGAEPKFKYEVPPKPQDVSIVELLVRHKNLDEQAHQHYSVGLSRFKEPEFQWMLSKFALEEAEHIKKLDELIEKYKTAEVLPEDLKNIHWVDPYMGEPGDRPWIE